MRTIDGALTGDEYTEATTIFPVYGSNGGYFTIAGADAYVQLAYGKQALTSWTDEVHVPVGVGVIAPGTIGIRFRSWSAGVPSVVSAGLSSSSEPPIAVGLGANPPGGGVEGSSMNRRISTASTNGDLLAGEPALLTGYIFGNQNAAVRYLKFYDTNVTPTVGTDIPVLTIPIPGGASGHVGFPVPARFNLGIGVGMTTGVADSDTGAVALNEIVVDILYTNI